MVVYRVVALADFELLPPPASGAGPVQACRLTTTPPTRSLLLALRCFQPKMQLLGGRPLFQRTRALVCMLGDWLVPSSRRQPVIVVEGPTGTKEEDLLEVRRVGGETSTERVSIQQWVRDSCPSLHAGFKASWWLWNGHLQTIYSVFASFERIDPISYQRTTIRTLDGGSIGIDFVHSDAPQFSDDTSPILVTSHGLTGGSHESYVRNVLCDVTKTKERGGLGIRACVVNFRGCAEVPVTSAQLYSAGHTDDLRSAVMYIRSLYPQAELLGLGFSLGASVLARYVGEEGDYCELKAACVVGAPWDCVEMSKKMESTWFTRESYSKGMASNLNKLLARNTTDSSSPLLQSESRLFGHLKCIKAMASKRSRPLLRDFDEAVTRVIGGCAPPFPFASAWEYYANKLPGVRIPLLSLNAFDDPIIAGEVLPIGLFKQSTRAVLAIVGGGGHLGWFEGGVPFIRAPSRWVHRPIGEFFRAALSELTGSKGKLAGTEGAEERPWAGFTTAHEEKRPFRWAKRARIFLDE